VTENVSELCIAGKSLVELGDQATCQRPGERRQIIAASHKPAS